MWIITLQHTATHCNTLQHTATHCCSLRQERKVWIITLQHTATHCNTLQHTATHCNTLLQSTPGAKSEDNRKDPRICTLLAGNSAYFRRILRCSQYIHTLHSWLNRWIECYISKVTRWSTVTLYSSFGVEHVKWLDEVNAIIWQVECWIASLSVM